MAYRSAPPGSSSFRAGLFGLFVALSTVACSSPEHSILITARSMSLSGATRIDTMDVLVIPTDPGSTAAPHREQEPVGRTFAEINGELPIHVALHLQGPTPVMVHLVATTNTGEHLYATRCYSPTAVVNDEVLLVALDADADVDHDGFVAAAEAGAACRDPGDDELGVPCDFLCPGTLGRDCDDSADVVPGPCDEEHSREGRCIHPGATDYCGDGIDQDCRNNGGVTDDAPCTDLDGDGFAGCAPRPDAGMPGDGGGGDAGVADGGVVDRGCDCNDGNPDVHPGADEICGNGIDDDCSGEMGGMGAYCDADGDGATSDVDCDDNNPNVRPGGLILEACCASPPCTDCTCDGIDNNCNGLVDEHSSCASPDLDGDGHEFCTGPTPNCSTCDCNDCDSGIHPNAVDYCGNGIDEDGVGGDSVCDPADTDQDGFIGGRDCIEGDPHAFYQAPEQCETPASESCGEGDCSIDMDGDHYSPNGPGIVDCNDDPARGGALVFPWAEDICDGINNDCDADGDEVLTRRGPGGEIIGCVTDLSCGAAGRCDVYFESNIHHCGACRNECNPGETLVANACSAGTCQCATNPIRDPDGSSECAEGSTCCLDVDGMGNPIAHPGCYDLQTSTRNCGGCGIVCDATTSSVCTAGDCACGAGPECTGGDTCCAIPSAEGATCHDLQTDEANCGACGFVCGDNSTCMGGQCVCNGGFADCDRNVTTTSGGNGCEINVTNDAINCGSCGVNCTDQNVVGGRCVGGTCAFDSCIAPFGDCTGGATDGCETSLTTVAACGVCGMSCTAAQHADQRCETTSTPASCGYGACIGAFSDCDGSRGNGCEAAWSAAQCGSACTNCTTTVARATGQSCTAAGTCDYAACASGGAECDGVRSNGCEATWTTATCGASCVNCSTVVQNATGTSCSASGTCDYTACSGAFGDCDGSRPNGCETSTTTATRCGSCTNNCTDDPHVNAGMATCSGSTCSYTCAAGWLDCGGTNDGCEQASDATHCGSCTNNCTDDPNITAGTCGGGGTCAYTCSGSFLDCTTASGCETNGATDATHCGSCANNCTDDPGIASATCSTGSCVYVCAANRLDCTAAAGCETTSSATNCGACGNDCTDQNVSVGSCSAGSCVITSCAAGRANCDGNTANGCEGNRGMSDCCGAMCTGGQSCMDMGGGLFGCG